MFSSDVGSIETYLVQPMVTEMKLCFRVTETTTHFVFWLF